MSWIYTSNLYFYFSSVQSLSHVQLFATPCTTAHQASRSITNSQSLLKLMPVESVMPSNHLILCHPLLLLSSIFPSIRVFSNESTLCIRWPKYWSFSFNISPLNEYSGLISLRMDWLDLLAVQWTLKSLLQPHSSKASKKHFYWFTYLWLCWVVIVACRLSLFALSRTGGGELWVDGNALLRSPHCGGFSCCSARALGSWASVVAHGQVGAPWHAESSQSRNQTHSHCWQADSYTLRPQTCILN